MWFVNSGWWLGNRHSPLRRGISLVFSLSSLVLITACTDYVSQIEDRYGEWIVVSSSSAGGSLTDTRDGQTYKTVTIGTQTWMAENLNYKTTNSFCYEDNASNCTKYGRLYTWDAAMEACPSGWHLPDTTEWNMLVSVAGGWYEGGKLKSTNDWYHSEDNTDDFGFSVLPAGHWSKVGKYALRNNDAYFWSSTIATSSDEALDFHLSNSVGMEIEVYVKKETRNSVRCVKDELSEKTSSSNKEKSSSSNKIVASSSSSGAIKSSFSVKDSSSSKKLESSGSLKNESSSSVKKVESSSSGSKVTEPAEVSSSSAVAPPMSSSSSSITQKLSSSSSKNVIQSSSDNLTSSTSSPTSSSIGSSSSDILSSSSVSQSVVDPSTVVVGNTTDSRDGQSYKTVTIGSQIWMAQNLNYETANSYCYDNTPSNCSKYGRLYTWAAAMDSVGTWSSNGKGCGYRKTCSPKYPVRGVCPEGWHLPTQMEWNTLITEVGGQSTVGKVLKSTSGWWNRSSDNGSGNGTDAYAFSALPAGDRDYDGYYYNEGNGTNFWSSSEGNYDLYAYRMYLYYDYDYAYLNGNNKYYAFSVRCVKD